MKGFAVESRKPEPTRLRLGGDVNRKGELVSPAGLSCLSALSSNFELPADAPEGERRRKLAEWIASPGNPLFSRVMVNRVWSYHLGAGIVANPNDFGFNGGRPSHPELLDWLAGEFIRNGWSVKKLQKLILMSETYRQSSRFDAQAAEKDAERRLHWRYSPQRLEGEVVRDAMLSISGTLNPKMYGPSFRPFQIVKNSGSYHTYQPADSADPEQQRRTVYRMNVNSGGNPMLEALDCPLPSVKTPKRTTTTTALQALSLMNNSFVHRREEGFPDPVSKEAADPPARPERPFAPALGRAPPPVALAGSAPLDARHRPVAFCLG